MTLQPPNRYSHFLNPQKHHKLQTTNLQTENTMTQPRFIFMTFLFLSLVSLQTHVAFCNGVSVLDFNLLKHSEIDVFTRRACTKSIGECLNEPEMDLEINRRILAMQKRYISYETLKRDMVPCDRAGASYYNCNARPAHPYNRGCEVITRCARDAQGIKN